MSNYASSISIDTLGIFKVIDLVTVVPGWHVYVQASTSLAGTTWSNETIAVTLEITPVPVTVPAANFPPNFDKEVVNEMI